MNGQRFFGIHPDVPLHRYIHIVLLQRSNRHLCPILSATLNPAVYSFYWPISKDISPKTTITPLWPVKSLKWSSVSLDGFNSLKVYNRKSGGFLKQAMKLLHRLQMALGGVFESHIKWHLVIHQLSGQLLQMWRRSVAKHGRQTESRRICRSSIIQKHRQSMLQEMQCT